MSESILNRTLASIYSSTHIEYYDRNQPKDQPNTHQWKINARKLEFHYNKLYWKANVHINDKCKLLADMLWY